MSNKKPSKELLELCAELDALIKKHYEQRSILDDEFYKNRTEQHLRDIVDYEQKREMLINKDYINVTYK